MNSKKIALIILVLLTPSVGLSSEDIGWRAAYEQLKQSFESGKTAVDNELNEVSNNIKNSFLDETNSIAQKISEETSYVSRETFENLINKAINVCPECAEEIFGAQENQREKEYCNCNCESYY
ncbi:hypothetical protein A3715_17575 [Oleiphilus sp. HI0009]|nr:hypothetical protein A3715_17575 [Oleiphilus sp. HI0009]